MRSFITLLAMLLLVSGAASFAQAPKKVALVIANSTYKDMSFLANPKNDAGLIAQSLKNVSFETVEVSFDLNFETFNKSIRAFRLASQGADVAMIYYAGHGIENGGKNWLIPIDAKLANDFDLPYEAIDLDKMLDATLGAKLRIVVMDACRNNPFGNKWKSNTRSIARGLADVQADDVLLIFAASPGQVAFDGDKDNSPFAEALAKRIIQPGLPVQMLGFKIRDDVLEATKGNQRPYTSGSITGDDLYLVKAIERPSNFEGGLGLRVGTRGSAGLLSRRAVFEQPKPIGEESWFAPEDFPSGALRTGKEGRVTYNLSIDETGAVTRCQIVVSSSSSTLDKATCDLLESRARFRPQMDSEGNVSAGNYVSHILWENPN